MFNTLVTIQSRGQDIGVIQQALEIKIVLTFQILKKQSTADIHNNVMKLFLPNMHYYY